MMLSLFKVIILVIFASSSLSAPLEDQQKTGCNTAKGAARSSLDVGSKDENVHLLADLDALSKGVKRSGIDPGCNNSGDKKSRTKELNGKSAVSDSADKSDIVHVIEETSVINEDEMTKKPIVETGKAAIRSDVDTNSTVSQKASENATEQEKSENNTSLKVGVGASASKPEEVNAIPQGSAAKTFIASKNVADVNASKRSGSLSRKVKEHGSIIVKAKKAAKKSNEAKSFDDAPSMQAGALSKEADVQEKAATKSTANLLNPLNSAIKSLDSATKLLGMAAASKHGVSSSKAATASNAASAISKSTESSPDNVKTISEQSAELKPSSTSNGTSQDVTSSTRSSGSSSTGSKQSSSTSAAKSVKDPYAEIAVGPDSPKMPDLKTGSDKTGLPVMKIDPSGNPPEQVSFDGKVEGANGPKLPSSSSSPRAGPQDVGGILDQLTDRLNKGGVAPENPLPPTESKAITDQLSDYDHDALDQAKGWEATGLKAIEKLKSAEFTHGNMKTELTKELSDRLAGGYDNALEGGLEGAASVVGNLDVPAQTSYPQADYSHQHPAQWPEYNSVESLDSEAQREEQSFSQYPEGRGGNYEGGSDPMMAQDQNTYDRQEIPSFLNAGMGRDSMDSTAGQDFYKRNLILRPYYSNTVPYGFQYPYDD